MTTKLEVGRNEFMRITMNGVKTPKMDSERRKWYPILRAGGKE